MKKNSIDGYDGFIDTTGWIDIVKNKRCGAVVAG